MLINLLAACLFGLGLILLVWTTLLFLEAAVTLMPPKRSDISRAWNPTSFAVLMPAHNEGKIIQETISSIRKQLSRNGRLIVIADNCTDDTADLARQEDAEVIIRTDENAKGKGYALAYGINSLHASPPDVVIIIDADCKIVRGTLQALSDEAAHQHRPLQALYLMQPPSGGSLPIRISAFAWHFRNKVRAEGANRLGFPCQLMGSGMAFPWAILSNVNFANDHPVEDLKLGLDFAAAGYPPKLFTDVVVHSEFPTQGEAVTSQRTRWEHGHLLMITKDLPSRMLRGALKRNTEVVALTMDASVPPLALLSFLLFFAFGCFVTLLLLDFHSLGISIMLAISAGFHISAIYIGWVLVGRDFVTFRELLATPSYALNKLPLYASYIWRRQTSWIKTKR